MNCTICNHPNRRTRAALDRALLRGLSIRATAHRFHVSEDALGRHRRHARAAITRAAAMAPADDADLAYGQQLLSEAASIRADCLRLQHEAEAKGDIRCALRGLTARLATLEATARLTGNVAAPVSKSLTVNMAVTREEALQYARDLIELFGPAALPPGSPQANTQEAGKANGHGD